MTERMRIFLREAAKCQSGKGIPVSRYNSRIAFKAVRAGYGWMIASPFRVFIIEDQGRKALTED